VTLKTPFSDSPLCAREKGLYENRLLSVTTVNALASARAPACASTLRLAPLGHPQPPHPGLPVVDHRTPHTAHRTPHTDRPRQKPRRSLAEASQKPRRSLAEASQNLLRIPSETPREHERLKSTSEARVQEPRRPTRPTRVEVDGRDGERAAWCGQLEAAEDHHAVERAAAAEEHVGCLRDGAGAQQWCRCYRGCRKDDTAGSGMPGRSGETPRQFADLQVKIGGGGTTRTRASWGRCESGERGRSGSGERENGERKANGG
jgi:hypothetical protein